MHFVNQIAAIYFCSFPLGKFRLCPRKRAIKMRLRKEKLIIRLGQKNFRGETAGASKLIQQTLLSLLTAPFYELKTKTKRNSQ